MKPRPPPPEAGDPALAAARRSALTVYVLHALASATLITFFVAIFVNYSQYGRVNGTIYESHFRWQIHTFWYCCVYSLIGVGIAVWGVVRASGDWRQGEGAGLVLLGLLVLLASLVWHLYRVIRGLMRWSDRKPMPV